MTIIWRSRFSKARPVVPTRALGTQRLTPIERQVASTFTDAVRGLTANLDTQALSRALSSGSVSNAVQSFDWGKFGDRMSTNRLSLLQQIEQTGKAEAKNLSSVTGRFVFDVTDPRATAWAAARSGEMIVQISDQLRNDIRGMITSAFVNQIDPRQIERELSQKIGLFDRWANAVTNSYNRNVTDFVGQGMSVPDAEARAQVLAEAYRDRLIDARANNIARTEVMTAANQGRFISWQQAGDEGLVDLNTAYKEWIAEADACDDCAGADGLLVPVDDVFDFVDEEMPPAHPSCRCTAVLVPADQVDPEVLAEQQAAREERAAEASTSTAEDITPVNEEPANETEGAYQPAAFISDEPEAIAAYWADKIEALDEQVRDDRRREREGEWTNGDRSLYTIYEQQGFNGLPEVIPKADYDALRAEAFDRTYVYRGLSDTESLTAAQMTEQYRSGEHFPGWGMFGNGTYASDSRATAMEYARVQGLGVPSSNILDMVFKPEARIIEWKDINNLSSAVVGITDNLPQWVSWGNVISDPGRLAAMAGYDAIAIQRSGEVYYCILNRTAMTIAAGV